jgi:hypothetical protein
MNTSQTVPKAHFNGADYVPERDDERLRGQQLEIWELMQDGVWRSLSQIARTLGHGEASISAQLRHLRKARFGFIVDKKYQGAGLYHYQVRRAE